MSHCHKKQFSFSGSRLVVIVDLDEWITGTLRLVDGIGTFSQLDRPGFFMTSFG